MTPREVQEHRAVGQASGTNMIPNDPSQADPSIVALMAGIKSNEGANGNYNAQGDKNQQGQYTAAGVGQWSNEIGNRPQPLQQGQIPANFANQAKQFGLDPTDFSPANQNKVIYAALTADKKAGLSPEQILSKWNSGDPNAYQTNPIEGTSVGPSSTANVAAYVKNGMTAAQKYAQTNQSQQRDAVSGGGNVQLNPADLPAPMAPGQTSIQILQAPLSGYPAPTAPIAQTQTPAQSSQSSGSSGFLSDLTSGNFGGAAKDAANFAFPIAEDISNDVQGKSNKNLLQQAADAGLSALWFAPGLDTLAPEAAAALEGAGTLGKLASGGLYGAGVGATAGGLGAISQGGSLGSVLKGAALGGATGGVLGGATAGASQFLGNLPNRITRGALKLDPETAQYALDTKGVGTVNSLATQSQKSLEDLSGQIQDILSSDKYSAPIPPENKPMLALPQGSIQLDAGPDQSGVVNGTAKPRVWPEGSAPTPISPMEAPPVQLPGNGNGAFTDAASHFPNSNYTPEDILNNAKSLIPAQDKLLDKIQSGTATLGEKNTVRSALDQATKSVYTTLNRPPEAKALGAALASALRTEVKTTAPETSDLFSQLQKEIHLQTALKKLQKRPPGNLITFRDLLGAGIGGGLGGIPGAAATVGMEKLGTTAGGQFAVAKALQGLAPVARKGSMAALLGSSRLAGQSP